jgi:hypothetical protein
LVNKWEKALSLPNIKILFSEIIAKAAHLTFPTLEASVASGLHSGVGGGSKFIQKICLTRLSAFFISLDYSG